MPCNHQVGHRLGTKCIRSHIPIAKSRYQDGFCCSCQFSKKICDHLRDFSVIVFIRRRQPRSFQCQISSPRFSHLTGSPFRYNFHPRQPDIPFLVTGFFHFHSVDLHTASVKTLPLLQCQICTHLHSFHFLPAPHFFFFPIFSEKL